ncbi:Uncharacterised protein [Burkholderia pseudomallei]|nr:Uncharacterised protein [Burkholderia pseudomallei]CAJ3360584.1 Uncharacterised protein [Burkholderia pseudomallei]CAJ3729633.1 Uncharacterised protein [Burkholderia pseudomallei]CAJ4700969.1 Uncharacterised protein [Burkholderia pseudomallei]CAJ5240743.1 Uncharacterised protein [Burkholderia pseudomallei]
MVTYFRFFWPKQYKIFEYGTTWKTEFNLLVTNPNRITHLPLPAERGLQRPPP